MAKVSFNVTCEATYRGELTIPDEIKDDNLQVLDFIRENLANVAVTELEWLADIDPDNAVTMDDIRDIWSE